MVFISMSIATSWTEEVFIQYDVLCLGIKIKHWEVECLWIIYPRNGPQ